MSNAPVCVRYEVSDGERFARILDSGEAYTTSDIDYTVKDSNELTIVQRTRG